MTESLYRKRKLADTFIPCVQGKYELLAPKLLHFFQFNFVFVTTRKMYGQTIKRTLKYELKGSKTCEV